MLFRGAWARALHSLGKGAGNSKCQRWLYLFSCFPILFHKTHILSLAPLFLLSATCPPFSCLCLRSPSPSGLRSSSCWYPPCLPPPSFPQPTSGPARPVLKRGCCHWEIARKCPGGLHQLLSYRDVKRFKLFPRFLDPDSRTAQLQWLPWNVKRKLLLFPLHQHLTSIYTSNDVLYYLSDLLHIIQYMYPVISRTIIKYYCVLILSGQKTFRVLSDVMQNTYNWIMSFLHIFVI